MLRRAAIAAACAAWLGCDVYTPDLLEPADGAGGTTTPSSTSAGGAGGMAAGGMGAGGMSAGGATSTSTNTSTTTTGGSNEGGQGGTPPVGGQGGEGGSPPLGPPWINELHYDNASADVGEGVEVAGPAGVDLAGWSLVAYNGNGGGISGSAATVTLTGTIPSQMNGFGARWFPMPGLENGAPDGIALIDDAGAVVQFLSYEGAFTATAGPANGSTSINLPVDEEPAPAAGMSLQLTGTGSSYADFTWVENVAASPDQLNAGQLPN